MRPDSNGDPASQRPAKKKQPFPPITLGIYCAAARRGDLLIGVLPVGMSIVGQKKNGGPSLLGHADGTLAVIRSRSARWSTTTKLHPSKVLSLSSFTAEMAQDAKPVCWQCGILGIL
ncbi:MAG TPA: hypothetical protein VN641_08575 [Urbifossiella sp.]|nr:hypothetical protein [Urbifossiella sp.]